MSSRFEKSRSRLLAPLVIGAVGTVISLLAYWALLVRENHLVGAQFRAEAGQRTRAVEHRFRTSVSAVYPMTGFVANSRPGTRAEFGELFRTRLAGSTELLAVQWIPRVTPKQRAVHEAAARQDGFTEYRITTAATADTIDPSEKWLGTDQFPVYYSEPQDATASMIGVDLATDPVVRPALIEACDTGRLSATGLRAWRDAGEQRHGVAVIRAVFRERGGADDDAQTRRKMLLGFIAVAVSPDVIMEESLGQFRTDIDVLLYDELTPSGRAVMTAYDSKSRRCQFGPLPSQASRSPLAPILAQLDIPGGRWSIGCVATAEYVEERRSVLPLVSLAFGLVITAGTALYARTIIGQTEKVQALVDRRTAELQQANEQLAREVSDRNRAEIALGESERRFRALVETTSDWIWETDDCGVYTYVSPRIFDLLGFAPEEVIGREPFDFMEPWAVKWAREQFRSLAEARQPLVRLEDTFIAKDGRTVVVETNALPIIDEEGRFCGYRGVSRDVTDRKRTEDELAYERFLLTTLLENSPDYIYFKDAKSHFLRISRELSRRFLLSHPEEAEGKTDFDFFEFRRAEQAAADEQEVMRSGRPIVDKEEQQVWPNGEITWVSTTKVPLRDSAGTISGTFGISRDITDRKRSEQQLQAAKEAAEAASRAKSLFLANMSHEVRTPLNAIIGMTELVLGSELSAQQRERIGVVQQSGEALLSLVDDLLDFSKIEAGRVDLEEQPFDLREMLGDAMKWLAMRAHGKGLELAYSIRPEVPQAIIGDCVRLRQVIVNLVGNAIKFTDRGEVVLDAAVESREGRNLTLRFAVSDTGIGVPETKLDRIFDAFEQADSSSTRRFGGAGLGLAISAKLAGLMGGKIWAESRVGSGSTFYFTARFAVDESQTAAPALPALGETNPRRALVVDDSPTSRRIIAEMLGSWNIEAACAAGTREAVELFHNACRSGQPFDLLVADCEMPEMDGFALVEQIGREAQRRVAVLMMLTSDDQRTHVERCERMGIQAYVVKPVKQSELFEAVALALGLPVVADDSNLPSPAEPPCKLPPLDILLVEDSLVNQKLAVALLERAGHRVTLAVHGREAVDAVGRGRFDLVLMDVQMPEMDGLEATQVIRAGEQASGRHIPIIAMTAHAMKGDRERCLAAGMDEYVSKPIRARQLFASMEAVLGHNLQPLAATPVAKVEDCPVKIDWSAALEAVQNDDGLLRIVIETFLEESPQKMAAIRQAIDEGDAASLRISAHALKGGIRYFGHCRAFELARELEAVGQRGTLGEAPPLLVDLDAELGNLLPLLRARLECSKP